MTTHAHVVRRHGPSAFGDDLRRFVNLTVTLATTEFKLRFFGSVLGYVWTLARPLMLFTLLYLVFTHVFRFGADIEHYPVYLLTSIMLWTFFLEATGGAVGSLVNREGLLRKMRFPRMVVPLSVALTALFNLGMNMIAVFVFVAIQGVEPRWSWLQMPLLMLAMLVLATGVAMLLSALFVRYRDVGPIWDVTSQALFYGSPVIYVITALPDSWERKAMANPIATILTQMRKAFIDPDAPSAVAAIGGWGRLMIPVGLTIGLFLLGLWVFNREAPRIAENL